MSDSPRSDYGLRIKDFGLWIKDSRINCGIHYNKEKLTETSTLNFDQNWNSEAQSQISFWAVLSVPTPRPHTFGPTIYLNIMFYRRRLVIFGPSLFRCVFLKTQKLHFSRFLPEMLVFKWETPFRNLSSIFSAGSSLLCNFRKRKTRFLSFFDQNNRFPSTNGCISSFGRDHLKCSSLLAYFVFFFFRASSMLNGPKNYCSFVSF